MTAFDDLLATLSKDERTRFLQATEVQRELLAFYVSAHHDIVSELERTLAIAERQQLSPTATITFLRNAELSNFIRDRIRRLNADVSAALERSGPRISALVARQVAAEYNRLGLPRTVRPGLPESRLLESRLGYAARRIASWNNLVHRDVLNTVRRGLLKGLTFRQIAAELNRQTSSGASVSPTARARSHMLTNTRYAVVSAANASREAHYRELLTDHDIPVRKMWVAARDSSGRLTCCYSCAQMHGTISDIGDDFPWEGKNLTVTPFQEHLPHPPLHPNCRCRIIPVTPDVLDTVDLSQLLREREQRLVSLGRRAA